MNADADYWLAGWTLRALRLVAHYSDPNGPRVPGRA